MPDHEWNKRRIFTPLDNEALTRYFNALVSLSEEDRVRAEFDKALDAGERPKDAAERALAKIPTKE